MLKELNLSTNAIRGEVERIIGLGSSYLGTEIPFTPKAKKILEQAIQEAGQLGQNYIGPEHLLLALTKDSGGVAAKILKNLGIDVAQVRQQMIQVLREAVPVAAGGVGEGKAKGQQGKALAEFGTDLTQLAAEGKIDPVIGQSVTTAIGRWSFNRFSRGRGGLQQYLNYHDLQSRFEGH